MREKRNNALGRGLKSLIPDINININTNNISEIELDKIYANPNQPRKIFDDTKIKTLSDSIRNNGLLQPIVVKPDENNNYMIIAGERRYRAAKMANFKTIPVIKFDLPNNKIMELALIENLQREDLNPIEEAKGYKSLLENYDITQEDISEVIGKSRSHVTNTLRLLNLGNEIIEMIEEGNLSAGHGRALLRISDINLRNKIAHKVIIDGISVRGIEKMAKKIAESSIDEKKSIKEKDSIILKAEETLKNILGRNVVISKIKNKRKVEITCENDDELNNLINLFSYED